MALTEQRNSWYHCPVLSIAIEALPLLPLPVDGGAAAPAPAAMGLIGIEGGGRKEGRKK